FDEGHAFFEVGGSEFETFWIVVDNLVVFLNGAIIIFLGVGNFAKPELGVGGEVCVAVVLQIILKLGVSEFVFAAGEVAEAVGIERIGGRSGSRVGGGAGRGRASCASGSGRGSATGKT